MPQAAGCRASDNFDETSPAHVTLRNEVKDDASFRSLSDWGGNVRFGSKADMCSALGHVRFTPNSDRESGHRQTVMSALSPKADMCGAQAHVCFGPIADIGPALDEHSDAWQDKSDFGELARLCIDLD